MAEKIEGIILNVRKYNDRNCIVTLYTRNHGRLAFITPLSSGKASNARRARLQPLALIATEINYKAGADLQRLGAFLSPEIWCDIYFHPLKRILVLFISEFLYHLLNATMPDPLLFDFLVNSIRLLDSMKVGIAEFHIPLLVALLSFSGIQPNIEDYLPGKVFDFNSGSFLFPDETNGPVINPREARYVKTIVRLNFNNIKRLRLTNANRRQILYGILNYFSYHFPGISSLKSPEVLREIF